MDKNKTQQTIDHKKRNQILFLIASAIALIAIVATTTYFIAKHFFDQNKDIVILYTNDIHGYFADKDGNDKLSYSTVAKMRQDLLDEGKEVLLLDAGDHLSGSLNAVYDHGKTVVDLMNECHYDAAALGNHEFDFDFPRLDEVIATPKTYDYLCCNLFHLENGKRTTRYTKPSKIFKLANRKVGIIGITTPKAIGDATPAFFRDNDGNYIYTFCGENECRDLYDVVQEEADNLKQQGCNYVIALAHLGWDSKAFSPCWSEQVVKHTNNIDAVIDGHSHFTMYGDYVKNKDGKDVIITQAGGYFNKIGRMTIDKHGHIFTNLIDRYDGVDEKIKQHEIDYNNKISEEFDQKIASSNIHFKKTSNETNIADLCADSFYYYGINNLDVLEKVSGGCDFAFVNNGGIRQTHTYEGDWTKRTCRNIFSFDNLFVIRQINGDTLRRAIEYSVRNLPNYTSGFIVPAGLKYSFNPNATTDLVTDPSTDAYVSGPTLGKGKVNDIQYFDRENKKWKPLNVSEEAKYKIAGCNYVFENGGDGFTLFTDEASKDNLTLYRAGIDHSDYKVLVDYIKSFDKQIIATENSSLNKIGGYLINYEKLEGSGRITMIS